MSDKKLSELMQDFHDMATRGFVLLDSYAEALASHDPITTMEKSGIENYTEVKEKMVETTKFYHSKVAKTIMDLKDAVEHLEMGTEASKVILEMLKLKTELEK